MRRSATRGSALVLMSAVVLAGCSVGRSADPGKPPGDGSSLASWEKGLATGVNGPIPVIVVDQFGYRPEDQKVAVLRQPVTGYDSGSDYSPGDSIDVIDGESGNSVFSGQPSEWHAGAEDPISGDRTWWFDFTTVTKPGRYFIQDPDREVRSPEFRIGVGVYRDILRDALRTFFYQRAGQSKTAELARVAWADGASHLGRGQDGEARSWLSKGDPSTARDLRGGWYDAGDYNKYTAWTASYVVTLLSTYQEHPDLVGDDYGIPESGNGVSDLLDEISWGLSWLNRMQQADGSVLCIEGLASASPPSAATGPSYYGPPTTNATLRAAAAFASAARAFSKVPELAEQSQALTARAVSAWIWAQANPNVTYFNNDESRQPGSGGLGGGQQETDDRGRTLSGVTAAVHLFERTGRAEFRAFIEANYQSVLPAGSQNQWTVAEQDVLLHYASLPGVSPAIARTIKSDYARALESSALFLPAVTQSSDPYRAPMVEYTWGSNLSKAMMGRMFALAPLSGLDPAVATQATAAAEDYLHYLHGVNPLGLVYLTNMWQAGAEHSANTLFHLWFSDGARWDTVTDQTPGPAPGFLVGGPNPGFKLDACCAEAPQCGAAPEASYCSLNLSPPLTQPAMKSYLQFNTGWPANSWEVTENSNGYQVQYIRLLAAFTE